MTVSQGGDGECDIAAGACRKKSSGTIFDVAPATARRAAAMDGKPQKIAGNDF
ncbi:hypothetical protein [Alloalcanivorax balearicus]|uniref:hypothetical protein n=1 Tax=Alloalcanivorax balearicus TaxID=413232 RepID=UPI0021CDC5C4|nr:hypothetical protein [Alloalcanivorax balearicus]